MDVSGFSEVNFDNHQIDCHGDVAHACRTGAMSGNRGRFGENSTSTHQRRPGLPGRFQRVSHRMFHRTRCGWELSRHLGLRWGRLWSGRRSLSGYQIRELISLSRSRADSTFSRAQTRSSRARPRKPLLREPGSYGPSGQAMAEVEAATRQLGR